MEINYNHNLIKELLKKLKKIDISCSSIDIDDIKALYFENFMDKTKKEYSFYDSKIIYTEKATGKFEICTDNEKLKKIFQEIKQIVKQNQM
jgi:hypothetical protein